MHVWRERVFGKSLSSSQFCREPKTVLKSSLKKTKQNKGAQEALEVSDSSIPLIVVMALCVLEYVQAHQIVCIEYKQNLCISYTSIKPFF